MFANVLTRTIVCDILNVKEGVIGMKEMFKSKLMVSFMIFMVAIGYINCVQVEMEKEITNDTYLAANI